MKKKLSIVILLMAAFLVVFSGCQKKDEPAPTTSSLNAPTGLTASAGTYGTKITLSWTAVTGASGYNVYRATSSTGTYTKINTAIVTTTSYDDTSSTLTTSSYYYKVSAIDSGNLETALSSATSGNRSDMIPTGLTASAGTYGTKIALSWTAVTGASGYNIYRATSSTGTYTKINTAVITTTSYDDEDSSLTTSTYYYKVSAIDSSNSETAMGSAVSGYKKSLVPAGLTASAGTYATKISLSWTAVTEASSYNVYRATSSTGTYTKINTSAITATSYDDSDTTLTASTYYYKVSSVDFSNLESAMSSEASGYKKSLVPAGVSASAGIYATKISLSWTAVTEASSYNVYRATSSTGTFAKINTSAVTTTTYDDSDTTLTTATYYYKVSSVDANNAESAMSSAGSGSLKDLIPTGVSASYLAYTDKVVVSWTAQADASGYNIYRASSPSGTYTKLNPTPITSTTYNDTTASSGSNYYYKVTSLNANSLESSQSSYASGIKAHYPAVTSLDAFDTAYSYIYISWTAVTGASKYKVYSTSTSVSVFSLSSATYIGETANLNALMVVGAVYVGEKRYWVIPCDIAGSLAGVPTYDSGRNTYISSTSAYGDGWESDNFAAVANTITLNASNSGLQFHTIHSSTDEDWVKIDITAAGTYDLITSKVTTSADEVVADTEMYLYQSDATTQIAYDHNSGNATNGEKSKITQTLAAGTYYLKIKGYLSSKGDYSISVAKQ
ncbi:MAG TPA: hypothetical protein DHW82_07820 [Spirochaetia bacterium]|nr:hypothetical protein [Spirochaetia bacterium]